MEKLVYSGAGLLLGALGMWLIMSTGQTPQEAVAQTAPAPDTPGYMIVTGTVHDRPAFMAGYAAELAPLYERYGGHYIAIGANPEILEGEADPSFVISKWPNADAARAFWNDPDYEALKQARIENGWGTFDVMLVEGLPAPAQYNPAPNTSEN